MKKFQTNYFSDWKNKIQKKINTIDLKNHSSIKILKNKTATFDTNQFFQNIKNKVDSTIIFKKLKPTIYIQLLQDKLEKFARSDTNEVVLQQSRFWASAITWVLMGGTAFAIGWISIAETDEVVIALGKLVPKGGVTDVQMPLEGIAKEILVKEGDYVSKGEVLIRLDTDMTQTKSDSLKSNLELNKEIQKRLAILVKEGAVSEIQYMQQKEKVQDLETEIKLNEVRLKYQEIISPLSGMVFDLKPKGPGYVAQTSQPVLKIVPTNNLIAEIEIDNRTIGFVQPGKFAEISIDSFPASDFGVIEGEVISIGSDSLEPDRSQGKGYRFPAKIKLKSQYLELKSGQRLKLKSGMSLNANIKLRKVTYLQLLLNKFTDKAESLKAI